MKKTLFEKIWDSHVVEQLDDDLALIFASFFNID